MFKKSVNLLLLLSLIIYLFFVVNVIAGHYSHKELCTSVYRSHKAYYRDFHEDNCNHDFNYGGGTNNIFVESIDLTDSNRAYTLKNIYNPKSSDFDFDTKNCFSDHPYVYFPPVYFYPNEIYQTLTYMGAYYNENHEYPSFGWGANECFWNHGFLFLKQPLNIRAKIRVDNGGLIAFFWYNPQTDKFYLEDYYENPNYSEDARYDNYIFHLNKIGEYIIYLFSANHDHSASNDFTFIGFTNISNEDTGSYFSLGDDYQGHFGESDDPNSIFYYFILDNQRNFNLETIYDQDLNICRYYHGPTAWNETIANQIGNSDLNCCGDDEDDFGTYNLDDGSIYICDESGWHTSSGESQCSALSGTWSQDVFDIYQNSFAVSNASDGCCGDDIPTSTNFNDLYSVVNNYQDMCFVNESDTNSVDFNPVFYSDLNNEFNGPNNLNQNSLFIFNDLICSNTINNAVLNSIDCFNPADANWINMYSGSYSDVGSSLFLYDGQICTFNDHHLTCLEGNNFVQKIYYTGSFVFASKFLINNKQIIIYSDDQTYFVYSDGEKHNGQSIPHFNKIELPQDRKIRSALFIDSDTLFLGLYDDSGVSYFYTYDLTSENFNEVYHTSNFHFFSSELIKWNGKVCSVGGIFNSYKVLFCSNDNYSDWNGHIIEPYSALISKPHINPNNGDLCFIIQTHSTNPLDDFTKINCFDHLYNTYTLKNYSSNLILYDFYFANNGVLYLLAKNQSNIHLIRDVLDSNNLLGDQQVSWNWLSAPDEYYVVHNLELPDSKSLSFISNGDEWYFCNATGNSLYDSDHSIPNMGTFKPSNNAPGACPRGYYYCKCIVPTQEDDYITGIQPNDSCIPHYVSNNFEHYTWGGDPHCLISPYLCNSDGDIFTDDGCGIWTHGHDEEISTDGCEIDASTDPFDPSSCAPCDDGFPDENNIPGWGDFDLDNDTLLNKFNCTNSNAFGNCVISDFSGEYSETICDDRVDNDHDGATDCADHDCRDFDHCSGDDYEYSCTDTVDNDDDGFTDCDDPDCYSYSRCQFINYSFDTFVASINESFICYDRSDHALITECCDYTGSCFNGNVFGNNYNDVDTNIEFLGPGAPLYSIQTFDEFKNGIYTDYVQRFGFTADYPLRQLTLETTSGYKRLNLTNIGFDYYRTLVFDIYYNNFSKIQNITLKYKNTNNQVVKVLINLTNYSSNGLQDYRWHHIVFPLPSDAQIFEKLLFWGNSGLQILIDNIYLGVSSTNNKLYSNYRCAGSYGYWLDEFDPDESIIKKNIFADDHSCTAQDYLNESNTDCLLSDIINNPDSSEWAEFDPYKLICDATISYKWTGTHCCGDDTNITNKEFYMDNKLMCWNGYYVLPNQRVSDSIYQFYVLNSTLNKFLFFKNETYSGVLGCLIGSDFIINNSLDSDNRSLIGVNSDINILSPMPIVVNKTGVCAVASNYYCNNDGYWTDTGLGFNFNAQPLILKESFDNSSNGCCPNDYCWNGTACVAAEVYEYNSTMGPVDNSNFNNAVGHINLSLSSQMGGFRCVMRNNSAVWVNSSIKYAPDFETSGFCNSPNFCFVDSDFSVEFEQNPLIQNDGCCNNPANPDSDPGDCFYDENHSIYVSSDNLFCTKWVGCVPSGVSIFFNKENSVIDLNGSGNFVCVNGSWKNRVSLLYDFLQSNLNLDTDFSFVCDKSKVLNNDVEGVYRFCEFINNGNKGVVLLLNSSLDDAIIRIFETTTYVKSEDILGLEKILNLNGYNHIYIYFYPKLNALILLNEDANYVFNSNSNIVVDVFRSIYEFFRNLFIGFDPGVYVLNNMSLYDRLFVFINDSSSVKGGVVTAYDEVLGSVVDRLYINYSGVVLGNVLPYALFENVSGLVYDFCSDSGVVSVDNVYSLKFNDKPVLLDYFFKFLRLSSHNHEVIGGGICSECNNNNDCNDGLVCEGGVCKVNVGGSCYFDHDCVDGLVCVDGVCISSDSSDSSNSN